jgi:AcrR family transcriptional regulator
MPRPVQYDPDDVLRQVTTVFWRNGYSRTSVRDLLKVTGFNRRGLYANFGGKEGLFIAALDSYRERYVNGIVRLLNAEEAGLEALRELFRLRLSGDPQRGCLVMNTIAEKFAVEPRLFELAKIENDRIEKGVRRCIRNALRVGDIPLHKDPSALAASVMAVLHGLGPVSRAGMSKNQLQDVVNRTIESLQS